MNTASTLLIVVIAGSLLGCGKASAPAASDTAASDTATSTTAGVPPPAASAETAPPAPMPETAAAASEPVAAAPASTPPASAAPAMSAPTTSGPTVSEPPASTAATSAAAAPAADLARGQQIYRQACAFCHDKGVAGAPKIGDAASWNPRLAQGMDALYAAALRGKGAMPAKGGNPSLSDADVKASVNYLVAQSR